MGRLPEAWIAPPEVRELRETVRHRGKLVALRAGLKAQVHAVLAKQGVHIKVSDLFGVTGRRLLAEAPLDPVYRARVDALCRLIDAYGFEIEATTSQLAGRLARHDRYHAIQALPGVGPTLAAVFVAEIGHVERFPSPRHLCSWAGLTPRHRESDTVVHRGSITKQGSTLVRWAAVEAVQKLPADAGWLVSARARLTENRGRNIATVAVARKLLTLVFYGLRDGHIRALDKARDKAHQDVA
jgi:transposase